MDTGKFVPTVVYQIAGRCTVRGQMEGMKTPSVCILFLMLAELISLQNAAINILHRYNIIMFIYCRKIILIDRVIYAI